MCRFLCYMGPRILLSELLYRPRNSLILQSYKSKERKEPLNGDGFGVGWYSPQNCETPGVFTSITPAWSNENLRRLSEHVETPCFFAHVRAASAGMKVSEFNCHPFQYGRYLWMHNGVIQGFWAIRRRLRESLPDELYNSIQGTTDSEHAFAVFLSLIRNSELSARELGEALAATVLRLEQWTAETKTELPSYYNFAVTDGKSLAAIRYISDPTLEPASLYYSTTGKYQCINGECRFVDCHSLDRSIVVSSERLNDNNSDWERVAPNHVLTVSSQIELRVNLIEIERHGSSVAARSSSLN
jgi:glutamine amidotransferase